jgi:hypothetical protein
MIECTTTHNGDNFSFNANFNDNFDITLEEIIEFYILLWDKLQCSGNISLIDNEKLKEFGYLISKFNGVSELSEENMKLQEIKKINEKIMNYTMNKKEYEYVYDYFIGTTSEENSGEVEVNNEEDNINITHDLDTIFYQNFNKILQSLNTSKISNLQVSEMKHFSDLLPLASDEFLKNKLKFDDEVIKKIKGEHPNGNLNEEKEELSNELSNNINIQETDPKPKSFLDSLNINTKELTSTNTKIDSKNKLNSLFLHNKRGEHKNDKNDNPTHKEIAKIDKEMEEEINNEIFNYTKNMKHYAKGFHQILTQDNKKLDDLERVQDKGKIKTDHSMKKLDEFNYSLKIGFWRLLFIFLLVGVSFVLTLLAIRIFPKLVK